MTPPPPLRTHQRRALAALEDAWSSGRRRAWVVLPPGAGKTRVGLETASAHLAAGDVSHVVVLSPNTAIQAQWVRAAREHGLAVGAVRELEGDLSSLTYQSLAVFDADDEVTDDPSVVEDASGAGPDGAPTLLDRLHPHGQALVGQLADQRGLLLVLDECHHLLEVWGRLLGEVLALLPEARVLGLTATPPEALRGEQAALVRDLFGETVFSASVPSVVREGDLAPFAELVWLTTPTVHEEQWLREEGLRFAELTTHLTDPTFGSLPFLSWIDLRAVVPVPEVLSWAALARSEPDLARAVLRLHHAGLVRLPTGARLLEEHRRPPTVEDWVLLLQDWLGKQVAPSDDPRDVEALEVVRRALPSVGHQWTRHGVRRGRSGVDRVLARSEAKTTATVEIVATEAAELGSRLRMLVLCDHERASATLPTGLHGVLPQQSGSAVATLAALVGDPTTRDLAPLLVTGSTVAGERSTVERLRDHVAEASPDLAADLEVVPLEGTDLFALGGRWSSRGWVVHVTSFFEMGGCQVLVGTRGLLGEGWDARRVTGLVDLTAATTLTAVVQTRGRALRTDPTWPEKVAVNWSVICVSEEHPTGDRDWARLVRKHEGFHGVDEDGDVVDGVGHLDSTFSAWAPPPVASFADLNARMRERAGQREAVARRWRVGTPYRDEVVPTLRVLPAPAAALGADASGPAALASDAAVVRLPAPDPATLVPTPEGIELRRVPAPAAGPDGSTAAGARPSPLLPLGVLGLLHGGVGVPVVLAEGAGGPVTTLAATGLGALGLGGAAALGVLGRRRHRELDAWARRQLADAAVPSVHRVACAVAQALRSTGQVRQGPADVVVEVHPGGEHRCRLAEATAEEGALFAEALDEVLAPLGTPRYVVARHVVRPGAAPVGRAVTRRSALLRLRSLRAEETVWHAVPTTLGTHAGKAQQFARAWDHWVGGDRLLYTGSPEGAGVLAAHHGADPFGVTTVLRRHWG
ncbi:DEAD/DEAH box helicase family protein [Nocardioides solisilvae]|uniref:DEAD/DEAH box helicase family protein n=1 Tax=Nocardioides solisilvae TaxID=1542435 RepID=UPI000D74472D|nr:DEAD/DEAH box helicase family protein [Nocardioides solisilvae]